jgi:hypothetical protein
MKNELKIALVVGCARSGTSILGELLAAHPDLMYIYEAHHVWEMAGMGVADSHRLTAEHATFDVRRQIRRWFEEQRGTAIWTVEKTPRNILRIPFLQTVFPEAKIIHIIRDGRDVACSLVQGIGGTAWHHLKPPSWGEIFRQETGVIRCAMAWQAIMEIALADLANVPHLPVYYEDLVSNPRIEARRLMRYLNLDQHPAVTAFCDKIQDHTQDSYHAQHQITWYSDNHRRRIGRWQENMSPEEQLRISTLLSPLLKRLGYEPHEASAAVLQKL